MCSGCLTPKLGNYELRWEWNRLFAVMSPHIQEVWDKANGTDSHGKHGIPKTLSRTFSEKSTMSSWSKHHHYTLKSLMLLTAEDLMHKEKVYYYNKWIKGSLNPWCYNYNNRVTVVVMPEDCNFAIIIGKLGVLIWVVITNYFDGYELGCRVPL